MLGLRGPYVLHFYICHQSGSLLAKREREEKKLKFLQAEFFVFLALSDQEEFASGQIVANIFPDRGTVLQITNVFMP